MEVTSAFEMKKTEVIQSEEWKYKSYESLVKWYIISDWYHFYFHQIYTDFTINNKTNVSRLSLKHTTSVFLIISTLSYVILHQNTFYKYPTADILVENFSSKCSL